MINGIIQPDIIRVDEDIILTKKLENFDFALPWYQDEKTVELVSGKDVGIYTKKEVYMMYQYQNMTSELYFIEHMIDNKYIPIGDVALSEDDMPIVIGNKDFRGKKIGQRVLLALIERARELGFEQLFVKEVYDYNIASKSLFRSVGFKKHEDTKDGVSFIMKLK